MNSKNLTVVIPHHNRRHHLTACLDQLCHQTVLPYEVIVVDYDNNAGHLRTKEYLGTMFGGRMRIRTVHGGAGGDFTLTEARNTGIKEVCTDLVVSLDCDCVPSPPALADVEKVLENHMVALAGAPVLYCKEDGTNFCPPWYGQFASGGFQGFRVEDLERIGGFNELMTGWGFEDRDIARRIVGTITPRQIALLGYPFFHLFHPESTTMAEREIMENRNKEIANTSYWDGREWQWNTKIN